MLLNILRRLAEDRGVIGRREEFRLFVAGELSHRDQGLWSAPVGPCECHHHEDAPSPGRARFQSPRWLPGCLHSPHIVNLFIIFNKLSISAKPG